MSETQLDKVKRLASSLAQDHETFTELQRQQTVFKGPVEERLDASLELVMFASFHLTNMTNLKFRLQRIAAEEGQFQFAGTVRGVNSQIDDNIQNVRTTLSALVERNRSLREMVSAQREREARREAVSRPLRGGD